MKCAKCGREIHSGSTYVIVDGEYYHPMICAPKRTQHVEKEGK